MEEENLTPQPDPAQAVPDSTVQSENPADSSIRSTRHHYRRTRNGAAILVLMTLAIFSQAAADQSIDSNDWVLGNKVESDAGSDNKPQTGQSNQTGSQNTPLPSALPMQDPFQDPFFSAAPGSFMEEMNRIQRQMDEVFSRSFKPFAGTPGFSRMQQQNFRQAINLQEKDNTYVVEVDVPNLDTAKLDVNVDGQTLTIKMSEEKKQTSEEPASGSAGSSRSYSHLVSKFQQSVSLPGPVKSHEMKIEREKGRLIVRLPKA